MKEISLIQSAADLPKIEERTLYSPIVHYLQEIGFKSVGETKVVKKHPDILFQADSTSFVIEVKIGKPEIGLEAVAQASDYAKKLNTQNIIILIYPEKYRNQVILDPDNVTHIALNEEINALVLTEYWTESLVISPKQLFQKLKQQLFIKKVKIDFRTIVNLIENYVRDLNSIVYQIRTEELVAEVVDKLDLFSSIGEIKDKETAKKQVINLASFLLFNQLLFYHIYNKKTRSKKLPELNEIKSIKDLQKYFDKITSIDYYSIYRVNILGHIPDEPEVINMLNNIIKAIKLLRAEHITQDLAGRFFHDLIPFEVRKVLAAFYTHPIAAELLAGLTIDSWDETVIDPACGSGTLLVAAYRRKQQLYSSLYGYKGFRAMHKRFIENDLTGIDIMPFAAHITTINLTMQNIEQETNIVRISTKNSLDLSEVLKTSDFRKRGIKISPYTETIQQTLFGISEQKVKREGALSPEGKGGEFYLKPVDVVIMNPPFSDREKMPPEMREQLKKNPLGEICGHQVNLWGYFLALADLLLKPGGKIGAVIPINIARGKATEKIRKFLLENYHIRYIVKPVVDVAFSEGASFNDCLFIAEKSKEKSKSGITTFVFLKKSIRNLSMEEIERILQSIKKNYSQNKEICTSDFDLALVESSKLLKFIDNMMPFFGVHSVKNLKILYDFLEAISNSNNSNKLNKFIYPIKEGFHASPAGLSELTFITNPLTKDRVKRAFLITEKEEKNDIICKINKTNIRIKIEKSSLIPALRTLTGVKRFFVDDIDFFIVEKPKEFEKILILSKWKDKNKFNWENRVKKNVSGKKTYLAIARRFRPDSPNTHLFAFFSNKSFIVPHTFKIVDIPEDEAIYQGLILNSIIGIMNVIIYREQTTEGYTDIMESDLHNFKIFNADVLTYDDKKTLKKLSDTLSKVEFPSIIEQLENRFWARIELDKAILKILGFSDGEINEWLPKVYDALVEELRAMKKARK